MKNIILALVFLASMQLSLATNVCVAPKDSTVIYFGNGINTSDFTDPLAYFTSEKGDTSISLRYSRNMEIMHFTAVQKDRSITDCDFNRRSDKFSALSDAKI